MVYSEAHVGGAGHAWRTSLDHMVFLGVSLCTILVPIVIMTIIVCVVIFREEMRECIYNKGQSKRIWSELYKVFNL